MVALLGDAELDEGNIYECLIEAWKHDIRNMLVDRRLQPPEPGRDHVADRMFDRFDEHLRHRRLAGA